MHRCGAVCQPHLCFLLFWIASLRSSHYCVASNARRTIAIDDLGHLSVCLLCSFTWLCCAHMDPKNIVLDGGSNPPMARITGSGGKFCLLYRAATSDWITFLCALESLGEPRHIILVAPLQVEGDSMRPSPDYFGCLFALHAVLGKKSQFNGNVCFNAAIFMGFLWFFRTMGVRMVLLTWTCHHSFILEVCSRLYIRLILDRGHLIWRLIPETLRYCTHCPGIAALFATHAFITNRLYWPLPSQPAEMEDWVGLGTATASKPSAQDREYCSY